MGSLPSCEEPLHSFGSFLLTLVTPAWSCHIPACRSELDVPCLQWGSHRSTETHCVLQEDVGQEEPHPSLGFISPQHTWVVHLTSKAKLCLPSAGDVVFVSPSLSSLCASLRSAAASAVVVQDQRSRCLCAHCWAMVWRGAVTQVDMGKYSLGQTQHRFLGESWVAEEQLKG